MQELLSSLNPMQRQAVLTTEGPLLLLAGAGSGKTRVITHRIAYLISQGIQPYNIIAITFTNKAAREMKERVAKLTQNSSIWVSTFHSTCLRLLRREIENIGYDKNFVIYDTDDMEKVVKSCIKELGINDKQFTYQAAMKVISSNKDELITPDEYAQIAGANFREKVYSQIYTLYQKKLKASNALDFDDLIGVTVRLFSIRPDILSKYQDRFRYIMVDEYQDTNTAQYKFVQLLSSKYKNICVVGDDDQSIYSFRGANIRNILDFEKDFKDAKVIRLEQNYRSTKVILETANSVILNNHNRKVKSLWTENVDGCKITYKRLESDLDEGVYLADTIKKRTAQGEQYKNFAVLYRTNFQSRPIEDQFVRANIPYRILSGLRFYERREIKDVLAYLRLLVNPTDDIALLRVLNVPRRGIGDTTIQKLVDYARSNDISMFSAVLEADAIDGLGTRSNRLAEFAELIGELKQTASEMKVSEFIHYLLIKTKYYDEIKSLEKEESETRLANIGELVSKAVEFDNKELETDEDGEFGMGGLDGFLAEVALVADVDGYNENDDTVVLMTLHGSKGLEFPTVFITGFEEGLFPSYRSVISPDYRDLEEERRLCYVGVTRAKKELLITACERRMQHGQTVYNAESRFLKEMPSDCIHVDKPVKAANGRVAVTQSNNDIKQTISNPAQMAKPKPLISLNAPKNVSLDYQTGDIVKIAKYGVGEITDIRSAGRDYEITINFAVHGAKKFMAGFAKIEKVKDKE